MKDVEEILGFVAHPNLSVLNLHGNPVFEYVLHYSRKLPNNQSDSICYFPNMPHNVKPGLFSKSLSHYLKSSMKKSSKEDQNDDERNGFRYSGNYKPKTSKFHEEKRQNEDSISNLDEDSFVNNAYYIGQKDERLDLYNLDNRQSFLQNHTISFIANQDVNHSTGRE